MNLVILYGNLARDPEIKTVTYGNKQTSVANFTIAVSRFFKRADGTKDKDVTFIPCEAWDSGAETIGKFLVKGDPVLVEGSLKTDKWQDGDGQPRSRMKVRVSNFQKLYRSSSSKNEIDETSDTPF